MITWIVQKNLIKKELLERLQSAIEQDGALFKEIQMIPFAPSVEVEIPSEAIPIIYGSTTLMLNAYQNPQLKPGVFFDPALFQMQNYVDQWGSHMLNFDGQLITMGDLGKIKSTPEQEWFVRPNGDHKEFAGTLISFKKLRDWINRNLQLDLPAFQTHSLIWLASPKTIHKEWRAFIVDGKMVAIAQYMEGNKRSENTESKPSTELIFFIEQRIQQHNLCAVYVMDIAATEEGLKIIECNCFNGTGFYNHNIEKVILGIHQFIRK